MMKIYNSYEKHSEIITNEAIKSLTEKPIKSTTFERVKLFHEADVMYNDLPRALTYSRSLRYVLDNCTLPIEKTDLILGRVPEKVLDEEEEKIFQSLVFNSGRPAWVTDQGHCSLWWEGFIELGFTGLKKRALEFREKHVKMGSSPERITFLDAATEVYDAFISLSSRYAAIAEENGNSEAAEVCREIALHEPRSFREALQALWLVQMVYCAYMASNPTLTYGRMDLLLEKIYEKDISEGVITREDAKLLVLDYYCKNNLIMGRGEHQMSAANPDLVTGWERNLCYDAPQYMLVGGRRPDGSYLDGDLSHLLVETVVPGFKNPVVEIRYAPDMQNKCPDLWKKIVSKMRDSSSIMVYGEDSVINGFIRAGAEPEDAFNFEHFGCNHATLAGIDYIQHWHNFAPLSALEQIKKKWVSEGFEPKTTDDIYNEIEKIARETAKAALTTAVDNTLRALRNPSTNLILTDCFHRYSIDAAGSFRSIGSKYHTLMMLNSPFVSCVDIVTAIDELVVKKKKMTYARLMEAVEANYEGYERELALCKRAEKVGSDDSLSNYHADRLSKLYQDVLAEEAERIVPKDLSDLIPEDILKTLPVVPKIIAKHSYENDNGHLAGKRFGATPDGRLAGVPFTQSCSPAVGSSCNGLTARLASVSCYQSGKVVAGAQNISIQPSAFAGDEGLEKLADVLGGYFEMGGLQVQVTSVDTETLRRAQENPSAYKDLMVRITGYSAVFVDLSRDAQNDIIRREEMRN